MTLDTELIILHTTKTGDSSVVIHTLSREYGRRSFFVRGAGKCMSHFLPLTVLEAEITESPGSRLYTAKKFVPLYPLLGIRDNLYKNAITLFLSEILYRVIKDGTDEPGLFDWCEKNILLLDAIESDFSNFHIRFLLELTVVLGFSPGPESLRPFAGEYAEVIDRFLSEPFSRAMLIPMSGKMRGEVAGRILGYIEYHTESTLNVNSLGVLHEILI